MATAAPAAALGRGDLGRLAPGLAADLVHLDAGLALARRLAGGRGSVSGSGGRPGPAMLVEDGAPAAAPARRSSPRRACRRCRRRTHDPRAELRLLQERAEMGAELGPGEPRPLEVERRARGFDRLAADEYPAPRAALEVERDLDRAAHRLGDARPHGRLSARRRSAPLRRGDGQRTHRGPAGRRSRARRLDRRPDISMRSRVTGRRGVRRRRRRRNSRSCRATRPGRRHVARRRHVVGDNGVRARPSTGGGARGAPVEASEASERSSRSRART